MRGFIAVFGQYMFEQCIHALLCEAICILWISRVLTAMLSMVQAAERLEARDVCVKVWPGRAVWFSSTVSAVTRLGLGLVVLL